MKAYQMPATEIVAMETRLCQNLAAQSQTGDPGAPQFVPRRGSEIAD